MEFKTYQHINLDYLNLMTDGDADMKKTMLEILFDELPKEIDLLSIHYASAAWEDLKSISHKLKSTLSFVGNERMTTANNQIEYNAMYVEQTDAIPGLIEEVKSLYPLAIAELKGYYQEL